MNKLFFFIFIFIFSSSLLVSSQGEDDLVSEVDAVLCLDSSYNIFEEMIESNFSVERINDTIETAKMFYDSQVVLKSRGSSYDFSLVISYCDEISLIHKNALIAVDELAALKKFYGEFENDIDYSEAEEMMNLIQNEIDSERYEVVPGLVEDTYQKLVEIRSSQTTLNLFYETTTYGLKRFLSRYWAYILSIFVVLFILFLFLRKPLFRYIFNFKLKRINLRKKSIKGLIMETQRDYFQDGKLSESAYNIRTKKLVEMIRDIDRQVPILNEKLAKLNKVLKDKR